MDWWTGPVTSTTVVIINTIIISNSGGNYAEKDEKKMRTLANGNRVPNHLASRRIQTTVDLMVNWYTIGSNSSHTLRSTCTVLYDYRNYYHCMMVLLQTTAYLQ